MITLEDIVVTPEIEENILDDAGFPMEFLIIRLPGEKYAALNVTPDADQPTWTISALAAFPDLKEAHLFELKYKMAGEKITVTFEEAIAIVKEIKVLQAIALQRGGNTDRLYWVK